MQQQPLAEIGFLASASDGFRAMVSKLAARRELAPGQVLFEQDDLGDALFAIITGQVEISVTSPAGQKLSLDMMGPGELLGEIALFAPGPRTATVTAIKHTEVWRLRNADVLAALRANPSLYIDMIELAGKRMRWMAMQHHEQVFMDAGTRLARKILHYCGAKPTELKMSHAELGAFVGTTRETVSKTLSGWKREGVIDLSRGAIRILDVDALKKIAKT